MISSNMGTIEIHGSSVAILSDYVCMVNSLATVIRDRAGEGQEEALNLLMELSVEAMYSEHPADSIEFCGKLMHLGNMIRPNNTPTSSLKEALALSW